MTARPMARASSVSRVRRLPPSFTPRRFAAARATLVRSEILGLVLGDCGEDMDMVLVAVSKSSHHRLEFGQRRCKLLRCRFRPSPRTHALGGQIKRCQDMGLGKSGGLRIWSRQNGGTSH
jgi:hypothetical protein